jgi:hypothetical protein
MSNGKETVVFGQIIIVLSFFSEMNYFGVFTLGIVVGSAD